MRKVCGLIKNELIKQYKKISVKVIVVLILLASIMLPVALNFLRNRDQEKWYIESYNQDIQWKQTEITNIDASKKNRDIQKKLYEEDIKMSQTLIDNNVSWDDWRQEVASQAATKSKEAAILSGISEGLAGEELFSNIHEFDINIFNEYMNMDKDELQKAIDSKNKESKELYDSVIKNDYLVYIEKSIKSSKEEIKNRESTIKTSEEEVKKNPDNKNLVAELENSKLQLKALEERLKATEYRYNNKISYDNKDWKNNTIKDIAYNIDKKSERLLSETEFTQYNSEKVAKGYTYEQYKKDYEDKIKSIEQAIALDWYSLENNIPQVKLDNDIRDSVDTTYLMYVSIAIILCIIIGGGIVSSEYSTGTVRLLMIRPVSRWKILLSKLISVFIIGYGVLLTTVVLNIISSGIINGFGGLATKVIAFSGDKIVEQNFIISIIPKLLFSSISLIFIIALVFAISTIIKNTALAVGLTTVAYLGSSVATMIMARLGMKWVGKTILPYMNLSTFITSSYYVEMFKSEYNIVLNPTMGAIQLLVFATILIIISFLVFEKRDVKN
ncbi:ABC transporter permease subunit [uncultured Clostridium sp.]|uniref:ABC transporter permease subunit n=1 Tax=uncultured Clostridium sp. TaxID=59620 RepID=UPI003217EF5A